MKFITVYIGFCLFCFSCAPLFALSKSNNHFLLDKKHNKYGGSTFLVQAPIKGITTKLLYYNSEGNLVKEENTFNTEEAFNLGFNKQVIYYSFGTRIKEERFFLQLLAKKRGIYKIILYYQTADQILYKKEQYFLNKHLGYNQILYSRAGRRIKLTWFYPNENGFAKTITEFNATGTAKVKETRIYSKKIREADGRDRVSYFYTKKHQLQKIEWTYTRAFEKDTGYSKKLKYFIYNPFYYKKIDIRYLNHKNKLVTPIHIVEFPF